ncbi:unnamed protein product [Arctogadus glacialis]
MESNDPQITMTRVTRQSMRQSTAKANIEARAPIKRTKRGIANAAHEAFENCEKETNNASGDTGSPDKKRRLEEDEVMDGDEDDCMDVELEAHLEKRKPQEKRLSLDPPRPSQQPNSRPIGSAQTTGPFDVNSMTSSVLSEHLHSGQTYDLEVQRNKAVESSRSERLSSTKSAHPHGPQEDVSQIKSTKSRSTADYQKPMAKAVASVVPRHTLYVPAVRYTRSGGSHTPQQHSNNVPQQKQPFQRKNQGTKKSTKEPAVEETHGSSPRGFCWYLTRLVCLLLLSAAVLLASKACGLQDPTGDGENCGKKVKLVEFSAKWSDLQSQFPGQRLELWKRSRIHLERHLRNARPTEPVSLILVAGRRAERTLDCLARGLAAAFSAAHNASVLHIDGAAAAGRDSDRVKMDIDSALQGAFGGGGDRPAAVIHRLEELPPGSTLIFYRYCDHENAAFKQVFLAFTVLLPQDHVETQQSLKDVEEIVQDYIAKRFVGSGSLEAFDRMDADKLSGLWSRISHLVLPVAAESQVELNGCGITQEE